MSTEKSNNKKTKNKQTKETNIFDGLVCDEESMDCNFSVMKIILNLGLSQNCITLYLIWWQYCILLFTNPINVEGTVWATFHCNTNHLIFSSSCVCITSCTKGIRLVSCYLMMGYGFIWELEININIFQAASKFLQKTLLFDYMPWYEIKHG